MAVIRAVCPRCGEVELGPQALVVGLRGRRRDGYYRFVCPGCAQPVQKTADRHVVALLLSAGVEAADPETAGPGPRPVAPPLTEADIASFARFLDDDAALARALAALSA